MLADPIKMLTKEDFAPNTPNAVLYRLAPLIAFVPALLVFAVIPFGPGDNFQVSNTSLGILFIFAIASLNVYGSGNQTRTFCYITDAMVGFLLVILRGVPGEAYNIGNPKPEISMVELVERISQVIGKPVAHSGSSHISCSISANEPTPRGNSTMISSWMLATTV